MHWQKWSNPIVLSLLHSPLRRLLGNQVTALTVTGRKTGKAYTFPVSLVRDGETWLIISQRNRTWWKNVRSETPVTIGFLKDSWKASGEVLTESSQVAEIFLSLLRHTPSYQHLFHLTFDTSSQIEQPETLTRLAREKIIIRLKKRIA